MPALPLKKEDGERLVTECLRKDRGDGYFIRSQRAETDSRGVFPTIVTDRMGPPGYVTRVDWEDVGSQRFIRFQFIIFPRLKVKT